MAQQVTRIGPQWTSSPNRRDAMGCKATGKRKVEVMGALWSRMSPLTGDRARGPKAAQGPTLLE
ncbi:hypothetical protein AB4084_33750, partial [Lysobacter sp. 2RAB21]